ncbi:MAG TPA: Glu/Leu/Phe/Val dehydrogenase dimerization domain-containing protein [Conexibacter sp.]|nr:Glu/Leu/Phe/Val dehydrogenase dimerization domain-containing protein [Conexibacter sp.]
MTVALDLESQFDHERVAIERRPEIGLTLILATHSTALGPGEGGLRMKRYPRIDDAIVDALRLSAAMTLKSSAAGLPFGGGKGVVLEPPAWASRETIMHAVGDVVERLDGAFIIGPDAGTSVEDMNLIRDRTRHVVGFSAERGGLGDPSPSTAVTVLGSIRHAVDLLDGATTLAGVRVGVLGVGKVGGHLVELLAAEGAEVLVADLDATRVAEVAGRTGATAIAPDAFLDLQLDVLAPCGAGELIGLDQVPRLRTRIVAGAANNPLVADHVADALHERRILYVPDFIANCGGVVHNSVEYRGGTIEDVPAALQDAVGRARAVLEQAVEAARPPLDVARELAAERIAQARAAGRS